jgi:hypothetical protein
MVQLFTIAPAFACVAVSLIRFAEFRPRQKPGSFNLCAVTDIIMSGAQQ